jgi:hypothetical protein
VVAVDPDNGAFVVTTSAVSFYNAGGVLPQPNSVCFLDGYLFFTIADGRCFATGINSTSVNALSFVTCEGKPDSLLRAVPFIDLYLAGTGSIEVWVDTAEAPPGFPFSRAKVIPSGILNANAITGFEDGFGKGLVFVGDDGAVYALNGYTPTKISSPAVDRAIAGLSVANQALLEMFSYVVAAHACIVIRAPTFTWVFDTDTLRWHERASFGLPYWRVTRACNAFGKWVGGDTESGNLVEIADGARDELGKPLVWQVDSGPVSAFPNRIAVAQAAFDMATGVGVATGANPSQTDPSVAIAWSDNGGVDWSVPLVRKLGAQAQANAPVKLTKTGMTKNQGRRWRLAVSDAVDVELTGGDQSAEVRA